jgi:hypothetical protein
MLNRSLESLYNSHGWDREKDLPDFPRAKKAITLSLDGGMKTKCLRN